MKIAFLCSSLEPGRDGVGDYTRRLAAECIRQGHPNIIIALNDQYKTEVGGEKTESGKRKAEKRVISDFWEIQRSEGTDVECLRLPDSLGWTARVKLAREWLENFKPDWVSLQFVPFGFHPKGLCFGLGRRLAATNSKARWHIMFHELWLGLGDGASLKHRVWGAFQWSIVQDLIQRLRPRVVHTQAEPYLQVLARNGIKAAILPLFGNIPPADGDGWAEFLAPSFPRQGAGSKESAKNGRWNMEDGRTEIRNRKSKNVEAASCERSQFYLAGVFGAVHPEWDAELAVNTVLPLVQGFQKRLVLVFFGKSHLDAAAGEDLRRQFQGRAEFLLLGERSDADISRILKTLDLGFSTSPRQMIQKSGSVATMLEHGLPVLVTRDDWCLCGLNFSLEKVSSRLLTPEQFRHLTTLPGHILVPSGSGCVKRVASQIVVAMELSVKDES